MSAPFFECHLKDMGCRYWYTAKTAVEHALRMTLPSECSNDGHFPKVLQQHLIEATRKRLRSANATRLQPWITLADFEGVLKLLKVQTVGSIAGESWSAVCRFEQKKKKYLLTIQSSGPLSTC